MEDNYFVDTGVFYANQEMIGRGILLSINTGILYDIEDTQNVKMIKIASDTLRGNALQDIKDDGPCFYGRTSIYREIPTDDAEIGNLTWEL